MVEPTRRHRRIRVADPGALGHEGLRDISASGLFLVTGDRYAVGQRVQFDIDIDIWGKGLHLIGRVLRQEATSPHGAGIAVEFDQPDDETVRWLERLVADLESANRPVEPMPPWKARASRRRGPHDTAVLPAAGGPPSRRRRTTEAAAPITQPIALLTDDEPTLTRPKKSDTRPIATAETSKPKRRDTKSMFRRPDESGTPEGPKN